MRIKHIDGRYPTHPRKPRFTGQAERIGDVIRIRLDDIDAEDFWLEIKVTRDELKKLLEEK